MAAITWQAFAAERPDLAPPVRDLLYQHGVGLAYLATVTAAGGPRVHPMCPLLHAGGLYAFLVPGPKQRDLRRDGRYALHSFPRDDDEDAAYLVGTASLVTDPAVRAELAGLFVTEREQFAVPAPPPEHDLVELRLETVMLTSTTGHGDPAPRHSIWHAG